MMDIAAGLTLLSQATNIVKTLREIDKGIDAASLKAQMADLYGTLADVKIALSDAREKMHEKDQRIRVLEDRISALSSGDLCPVCKQGRFKIVSSQTHPTFGDLGVLERTMKCDQCEFTEQHTFDPSNS